MRIRTGVMLGVMAEEQLMAARGCLLQCVHLHRCCMLSHARMHWPRRFLVGRLIGCCKETWLRGCCRDLCSRLTEEQTNPLVPVVTLNNITLMLSLPSRSAWGTGSCILPALFVCNWSGMHACGSGLSRPTPAQGSTQRLCPWAQRSTPC